MDGVTDGRNQQEKIFPAAVVKIIDDFRVVINRGSLHKVRLGQKFLIYRLSNEEIKDPESGESLGYLELVMGRGKVIHVQEKMSTLYSDTLKVSALVRKLSRPPVPSLFQPIEEIIESPAEKKPFVGIEIGDKAKPI